MIRARAKQDMPPRWGRFGTMKAGDSIRCTMDELSRVYGISPHQLPDYFDISRH